MQPRFERASRWIYRGLWGVLVRWFRVPDRPPTLPTPSGEAATSFQPSDGFLRYLKFQFWVVLVVIDGALLIGWAALTAALPVAGLATAPLWLAAIVLPDIVAYLAIHLRYDSTWYVMTNRSLRLRRGIWIIHETTITFENVQNVVVNQGPLQRIFGIADVLVETAGGGAAKAEQGGGGLVHRGLIEGVAEAPRIRDQILARLRHSRSAGLGDEGHADDAHPHLAPEHVRLLREIRDAAKSL